MQNAPDIDVIVALDIAHQMFEALDGPGPDAWQLQFEAVGWRSAGGVVRDMSEGLFDGIDETQGDLFPRLLEMVLDSLQEILVGPGAPDDGLYDSAARRRIGSRRSSK